MWKLRAVTESWLQKAVSFLKSSIDFSPKSVGCSDLWGVWERIAKMLEVRAESLFIISLLFRKWKSLRWKAIEGLERGLGFRAPCVGSWQPLLAQGPGAIQAMAYFAVHGVRGGRASAPSRVSLLETNSRASREGSSLWNIFVHNFAVKMSALNFWKKTSFPSEVHWLKCFSLLDFCF